MRKKIAKEVTKKIGKSVRKMNEAAGLIRENCLDEERRRHFAYISHAMALLMDELEIIYEEYPELKVEEAED